MCRFTFTEKSFRIQKWLFLTFISMLSLSTGLNAQCDISCKTGINISIDEDCQALITPEMVVTLPAEGVTIQVFDRFGNLIPGNIVTLAHVGQEVMIIATEPICGNTCMGMAFIEDKIAPVIECFDVTIGCADLIVFENPIPISCDIAEIKIVGEQTFDISCFSDAYQQQIVRQYQAFDSNGNASEICEQVITIEKFDLRLIDFPTNTDTSLYCGGNYKRDEAGNPRFDILGGPTLSGEDLYPDQFIICNTYVDYEDQVLSFNNCVTNVLRTWTISSWFCGIDNVREFNQLYTIIDTVGPEFICPTDMTVSTSGNSCQAIVNLPALEMTDECNTVTRVDINYTGGFLGNSNGGIIHLDAGVNTVTYTAYDECGNASSCSFKISVVDKAQPVTVCDQFTTIALSSDGTAKFSAEDLDDGSFDECGPVTLEIRRVTNNACFTNDVNFGSYVTFCCEDLEGEHMVELRVTDASGNTNTCMAFVEVQDKLPPVILAGLPDITVSCTFAYDPDNLNVFGKVATHPDDRDEIVITSEIVQFKGPALDALVIDNCTSVQSDEVSFESINQCGIGFIIRTVIASNPEGQKVSFSQRITFKNNESFTEDDITWPKDFYPAGACSPSGLSPDDLPAGFNVPTFTEDECDMIGVTYEDRIITNTPNGGGCFKIIRTWYISDWCQNMNGKFPVWSHDQYIEVENTIAPVIQCSSAEEMVCVYDANCGPGYIELEVTGSDDCVSAENLIWFYEIDYFSDGSVDATGNTNKIAGEFAVGVHSVRWILSDGCGNSDICTQSFEIRNCKNPTPYCINGLSADLTPMDTNGDGDADTEMIMITPDYFDAGSSHACGYEVTLSFSSNVNDTIRIFDCDDIGRQEVQIWVTDLINGNQDFCSTYIIIQDNNNVDLCPEVQLAYTIRGSVMTENDEAIGEVAIALEGSELTTATDENGEYVFTALSKGASLRVIPNKETDPANGVSTLDLIMIQKHILGLEFLSNNYRFVAADINNSGTITAADLIVLRKFILGMYQEFPDNSSWRFLDLSVPFMDNNNPWANGLPEKYNIPYLNADMDINFVGVKIGDVNYSLNMGKSQNSTVRSNDGLKIYTQDRLLRKGETYNIQLNVNENKELTGYQLGLQVLPEYAKIVAINGASVNGSFDYVGTKHANEGILTTMFFDARNVELMKDEQVINISITSLKNANLSEILSLNNDFIVSESYTADNTEENITLSFRNENEAGESEELLQNTPNPWTGSTKVSFILNDQKQATFNVYDVTGRIILSRTETFNKGLNEIEIAQNDIPGIGVYYYELKTAEFKAVKKMIMSR